MKLRHKLLGVIILIFLYSSCSLHEVELPEIPDNADHNSGTSIENNTSTESGDIMPNGVIAYEIIAHEIINPRNETIKNAERSGGSVNTPPKTKRPHASTKSGNAGSAPNTTTEEDEIIFMRSEGIIAQDIIYPYTGETSKDVNDSTAEIDQN